MHHTYAHIEAEEESKSRQHAKGDPETEIFLMSVDGRGEAWGQPAKEVKGGMTWKLSLSQLGGGSLQAQ
jgi:hypothetical protein